jgi:hypothetical protein
MLIFTRGAIEDIFLDIFPRLGIGGVTTHLALLQSFKAILADILLITIYIGLIFRGTELTAFYALLIILTLIAISADPILTILIASALIVLLTITD